MDVGYLIKKLRLEKGMTQQELCERVGMKRTQFSRYETGLRTPKMDTLLKIANALECDVSELLPQRYKSNADMETDVGIGGKIKEYREKRGLTQQELCERVGMKQTQFSRYETGLRTPKTDTLLKIANALECDVSELLPQRYKSNADMETEETAEQRYSRNCMGEGKGYKENKLMPSEQRGIYLGQTIRRLRKEKGKTQQELCDSIGMKRQQLSMYENGVITPKMATVEKIAGALGCDVVEMIPQDLRGRTDDEIERESEYRRAFQEYMGEGGRNASTGEKIREYREKRGMTQQALCDSIGIKRQQLSQYETSLRTPTIGTLNRIAAVLQCTILDLAGCDVLDMLGGASVSLEGEDNAEQKKQWMGEGKVDENTYSGEDREGNLEIQVDETAKYKQIIQANLDGLNEKGLLKVREYTEDITKIEEYRKKNAPQSSMEDK